MSLQNWIPEIWAGEYLKNLHKAHVFGSPQVINRDYQGEINSFGDTVRINSIGAVTISDYTRNTDMAGPQSLDSAQSILQINQAKYFNFVIDDLDKAQTNPKAMGAAMYESAYAIADITDNFIAGLAAGKVASANTIGTSGAPKTDLATSGKAYGYLVALAQDLDQTNTPRADRWVIVPPWFYAWIRQDSNFLHATNAGDVLLRQGQVGGMIGDDFLVGQIAGFSVWMSNNSQSLNNAGATSFQILAGHASAWSYAEQIAEIEAYRPQLRFGDAVKGLHVYGACVTRPQSLALLYANPT